MLKMQSSKPWRLLDQDNGKFSHDIKVWEDYQQNQMLEMAGIKKDKKK